jgi:hypothetical protein
MNRLRFGDNLRWQRDSRLFPDAGVNEHHSPSPLSSPAVGRGNPCDGARGRIPSPLAGEGRVRGVVPAFNSNADYNVLFREASGVVSQAEFHAFTDTWSWVDAADTYNQFVGTSLNETAVVIPSPIFISHCELCA